MRNLKIAAFGSSFAAGPGIQPQVNRSARRSGNNYAHMLAERLGAELTDMTVSGATLKNVLSEPQTLFGTRFEPQLEGLPHDVDVVTITAGGNDLKYIGLVIEKTFQATYIGRMLSYLLPKGEPADIFTEEEVAQRFIAIIDRIHEVSPGCRIFLVEYLTLFGSHTRPGVDVALDESQILVARNLATTLQNGYRLAVEARPACKLIPVAEASWEHDIGSEEPWVEGFSLKMVLTGKIPFHPNQKGMEAVADILYLELKDTVVS